MASVGASLAFGLSPAVIVIGLSYIAFHCAMGRWPRGREWWLIGW